jgi:hypothetical protein
MPHLKNALLFQILSLSFTMLISIGCDKKASDSASEAGQTYSFTTPMTGQIQIVNTTSVFDNKMDSTAALKLPHHPPRSADGPTLCSSVVCFTPTAISGKYFGTGLLIQSNGNGMMAYFGQESWSGISGTSTSYAFDLATPILNTGNLVCCTNTGALNNGSSYIESIAYLFGYLDVTFTLSGITGNVSMNGTYTLRFVLADGAITDGVRGDVLIFDSGNFKWMNSDSSTLTTTRPANPVVMNTGVTNWTNPFGTDKGNQNIPVIYANVIPSSGSGLMLISDTELQVANKTYSFGFNPKNFVVFPTLINDGNDINMIYSEKELMRLIHLGGLPHSQQAMGIGGPADTELVISQ